MAAIRYIVVLRAYKVSGEGQCMFVLQCHSLCEDIAKGCAYSEVFVISVYVRRKLFVILRCLERKNSQQRCVSLRYSL